MIKPVRLAGVFALAMFCCSIAPAQTQEQPRYSRDLCVKVKEGKGLEYTAYLRDVTIKLAKVRLDEGVFSSFTIAQAVVPAGRSARCDYHFVTGYIGFPPEPQTPEMVAADVKKAGITMSREAMAAKRDDLSYLVGMDIWRWQERVGTTEKGSYARLNYYKTNPGMTAEWARMESTGWKPLAEAMAKENAGTGWRSATLAMPSGSSLPYNAMTVDIFPSWTALGKGFQARAMWNKAHPESDMAGYMDQLAKIVERPRVDIVRLIEVMGK
jgi:hypothetical protein